MKHRFEQLDALRGIASLQVVNHHVMLMSPLFFEHVVGDPGKWTEKAAHLLTFTPFHFFWGGAEAVLFFFVLSGFVLASAVAGRNTLRNYGSYLIKRFFRLYIPFAFIILISMWLRSFVYNMGDVSAYSNWFRGMWNHAVTPTEYLQLITFLSRDTHNIVTTLWSIEIEIKLSILIPIALALVYCFKKYRVLDICMNLLLLYLAFRITDASLDSPYTFGPSRFYDGIVLRYTLPFMVGILLYKYNEAYREIVYRMPRWLMLSAIAVCVFLYCTSWTWGMFPDGSLIKAVLLPCYRSPEVTKIAASAAFIILSFNSYVHNFLHHRLLAFLGRISFSLYMVHPLMILCCSYTLVKYTHTPVYISMLAAWLCSFPAAYICYRLIEDPINNLGRKIAGQVQKKEPKSI